MSGTHRLPSSLTDDDRVLMCPADREPTALRCPTCDLPICPQCFVWTAVGLRCADCAAALAAAPPPPTLLRRVALPLAAVLAGALVLAVAVLLLIRHEPGSRKSAAISTSPSPTQVLSLTRTIEPAGTALSFEVPADWQIQPGDAAGPDAPPSAAVVVSPAGPDGSVAWVRTFLLPDEHDARAALARIMDLVRAGRQGLGEVTDKPAGVANRPAWSSQFTVPLNADGTGPVTEQTYYFVEVDGGVAVLSIVSTAPLDHARVVHDIIATLRTR